MSTDFPADVFTAKVAEVLGWPPSLVIMAGAPLLPTGTVGGKLYGRIIVTLTTSVPEGTDDERLELGTYPNAATVAVGNRLRLLTIRCESVDPTVEAVDVLERLRTKLQKRSVRAALRTDGALAIVYLGTVRQLSYQINNRDIACAILETQYRQKVSEDITESDGTGEYIETAEITEDITPG